MKSMIFLLLVVFLSTKAFSDEGLSGPPPLHADGAGFLNVTCEGTLNKAPYHDKIKLEGKFHLSNVQIKQSVDREMAQFAKEEYGGRGEERSLSAGIFDYRLRIGIFKIVKDQDGFEREQLADVAAVRLAEAFYHHKVVDERSDMTTRSFSLTPWNAGIKSISSLVGDRFFMNAGKSHEGRLNREMERENAHCSLKTRPLEYIEFKKGNVWYPEIKDESFRVPLRCGFTYEPGPPALLAGN